jgi:hypothetical protein
MEMGFSAQEVKSSGFTPQLMRQEQWPPREMTKAFKPLELRHAGYSARDLRDGGLGPAELKRVGYSSAELHNAGFSSTSIKAMNRNLTEKPDIVPHFDFRKMKTAPQASGHTTPRVRHFSDDVVKLSRGVRKSQFQNAAHRLVKTGSVAAILGKAPGRLSVMQKELGLVKRVQVVTAPQ